MAGKAQPRVWNPSKIAIVGIVAIGLAAALFSLWYHRQSSRRSLEFWGTEPALLITRSPRIEALALQPADTTEVQQPPESAPDATAPSDQPIERLGVAGNFYLVTARSDATRAPGVSNIRRAIVLDPTYKWEAPAPAAQPIWQYALAFRDGERSAIVLFDFDSGRIGSVIGTRTAVLDPAIAEDWHSFFEEQFETAPAAP